MSTVLQGPSDPSMAGTAQQESQRYLFPMADPAPAHERVRGRRYVSDETERRFGDWQLQRMAPVVRIGMASAFAGGWFLMIVALVFGGSTAEGFWVVVALSSPGFVFGFVAAGRVSKVGHLQTIVAVAVVVWGALVIIGADRYLRSPALATTGFVIVVLYALQVFRIDPPRFLIGVGVLLAVHAVVLVSTDASIEPGKPFHLGIAVAISAASYVIGSVNDRADRSRFEQGEMIEAQRAVIEAERDRSDLLLHRVLPGPVVERLQRRELVVDHLDAVTVLFADLVGFTALASRLEPRQVIELLDRIFSWMDELALAHGVERIKTVGDSYMAVGGAPEPSASHVEAVAAFAVGVRDGLASLVADTGHEVDMRIGFATGHAIAGVLGRSRITYDLWSSTVNLASRLEATGVAGRIQVDASVVEALGASYAFVSRGPVDLKGIGPVETYFLEGRTEAGSG